MIKQLEFNFHDLIGVIIESDDPSFTEFYSKEFQSAEGTSKSAASHIFMRWRRSTSFGSIPTGFQFHSHKLLARWAYRIVFSPSKVEIEAIGNRWAIPMVHHMLLHPTIRFLSSRQNVLMLHGSAVVKNTHSLIFTGRGGAGKTTTSSLLLHYGGSDWQLHADDYLFIAPNRSTLGYLTRSHLYLDILDWIPGLGNKLTRKERLRLYIFGRLRRLTKDGIKWPVRLPVDRLWPKHEWANQAKLAGVILLRKSGQDQLSLTPALAEDLVVEELLDMNFYEVRHYCALVDKCPNTGLPDDWFSVWKNQERKLLHENLIIDPVYWLDVPDKPAADRFGTELIEILETTFDSLIGELNE